MCQPPLTYVSASTPSGAQSTLRVRVNDLLWREASTLYGRGPHDHVFVTQTDDAGKTTIQWGDGVTGAHLPSGQDNVRVTYRKGIGVEGLVKAEQLSLLPTRPLGVKAVINPLPATGAADRESLADARHNAPLTVLTLDRTVSLQDYENFARAYAGIAKALATWTWEKQTRRVFVTVAGPNGAEVMPDSDLYKNLLAAMQKAGDPYVDLRVKSYRQALFTVTGDITVGPAHQPPAGKIAIDPALGRIAFADALAAPPLVSFHYGFSADMGGGEYEREASFAALLQPVQEVTTLATIQAALTALSNGGVVQISDSGRYVEALSINVNTKQRLELRSANKHRPTLVLSGDWSITGDAEAEVTLNGLLITGGTLRVPASPDNKLRRLRLQHCTLVPGLSLSNKGEPEHPDQPSLVVELANVAFEIDHCIIGGLRIVDGAHVQITDSIVDATSDTGGSLGAAQRHYSLTGRKTHHAFCHVSRRAKSL